MNWLQCRVIGLGYFLKFMAAHVHTKVARIFGYFLGYFGKWYYLSKICCGYFWDNYWKNWATLNSNIWSHCFSASKGANIC